MSKILVSTVVIGLGLLMASCSTASDRQFDTSYGTGTTNIDTPGGAAGSGSWNNPPATGNTSGMSNPASTGGTASEGPR